jgi:hypothetical protein
MYHKGMHRQSHRLQACIQASSNLPAAPIEIAEHRAEFASACSDYWLAADFHSAATMGEIPGIDIHIELHQAPRLSNTRGRLCSCLPTHVNTQSELEASLHATISSLAMLIVVNALRDNTEFRANGRKVYNKRQQTQPDNRGPSWRC